jgi:hypothetical protein
MEKYQNTSMTEANYEERIRIGAHGQNECQQTARRLLPTPACIMHIFQIFLKREEEWEIGSGDDKNKPRVEIRNIFDQSIITVVAWFDC